MSAWSGWAGQLLTVLGDKNTTANLKFLNEWHSFEQTNCANNPISASQSWAGSSECKAPVRNYRTRADGLQATAAQLHDAKYSAILAALKSGDPYGYSDSFTVSQELDTWGSLTFSTRYSTETAQAPPDNTVSAPRAHKGWADMRRSTNYHWPAALRDSDRHIHAALRSLSRARKVRL